MNSGYYFLGTLVRKLESDGKMTLPAEWSPKNRSDEVLLTAMPDEDGCVLILGPERTVREQQLSLDIATYESSAERRAFSRRTLQNQLLKPDSNGRIKLQSALMEHLQMEGTEAVLVGSVDVFEIWEPKKFAEAYPAQTALEVKTVVQTKN